MELLQQEKNWPEKLTGKSSYSQLDLKHFIYKLPVTFIAVTYYYYYYYYYYRCYCCCKY